MAFANDMLHNAKARYLSVSYINCICFCLGRINAVSLILLHGEHCLLADILHKAHGVRQLYKYCNLQEIYSSKFLSNNNV